MSAEIQNWDSQPLLGNRSANTPTVRRWSNKHLSVTAVTSYNNTSRRAAVDGVFCAVLAYAIGRGPADTLGSAVRR
jgi:hypothetical protein